MGSVRAALSVLLFFILFAVLAIVTGPSQVTATIQEQANSEPYNIVRIGDLGAFYGAYEITTPTQTCVAISGDYMGASAAALSCEAKEE